MLQVGSSRSTRLAQQCMERCIRTHAQCPKPQQVELPTRVIDCSDVKKPKLILGGGRRGRYAALSYVWGGPQFCTTTENIHSLVHEGIDNHTLPQTILDAIRTTNSMGIPYLWVDALCILQDSDTDKYTEIGRMRMVYRNAHVTIIAASSAKAVDGFLQDRSAPPHTRLPFHCPDGRLGTFSLLPDAYIESEEAEPVDTRGWCLQERLLSPRALIYTSSTLQFECQMETVNVGGAVCPPSRIQRATNTWLGCGSVIYPAISFAKGDSARRPRTHTTHRLGHGQRPMVKSWPLTNGRPKVRYPCIVRSLRGRVMRGDTPQCASTLWRRRCCDADH